MLFVAVTSLVGASPASSAVSSTPAPVSWLTYGFSAQRTGYNPGEATISPANATALHELWSVNLGAVMLAQPVEAASVNVGGTATNIVYEGTEHGDFYAVNATDGHVIWHRNLGSVQTICYNTPDGVWGIGGAATIAFTAPGTGVIYVAGGDGSVHAMDLASGQEAPGWPVGGVFTPAQEHVWSAVNLFAGKLYVTVASHCDRAPYSGDTVEIDTSRPAVINRFYPAGPPSGGISGGGIWGYGGAAVDPSTGHVFVATGNALTTPQNYGLTEAVVELSPALGVLGSNKPTLPGKDADFGATPTLFHPAGCPVTLAAAKQKSGALFIYTVGHLNDGYRQRIQLASASDWRFNGLPAWDPVTNMLYVSSSSDSGSTYLHGMVALKASANCSLSLAWQKSVGPNITSVSSPTVANGVVYYGDGKGKQEFAFDAAKGNQLWTSGSTTGQLFAAPTVVNGELLVASWDHHLYAFGP